MISALFVILSLSLLPVSVFKASVGFAIVLSSVNVTVAVAVLPAVSVSVTTTL